MYILNHLPCRVLRIIKSYQIWFEGSPASIMTSVVGICARVLQGIVEGKPGVRFSAKYSNQVDK